MMQSILTLARWKKWTLLCSNSTCRLRVLAPRISRRYAGIHLGEEWFCSGDCFEEFLCKTITGEIALRHVQEPALARRMPLGLLLVSRGVLTSDQLALALKKQKIDGTNLGEALLCLGFATADQVTSAVATQWSCPVLTLGGQSLSLSVHVPRRLLEEYEMLPVHLMEADKHLMMGFVSRVQYQILSTIEHITGCNASPCFITIHDYRRQMLASTFLTRDDEIVFDRPMSTGEIGRMCRNYVSQLGATETRFGICRDYLWMRIWNRQHETDLLFLLPQE